MCTVPPASRSRVDGLAEDGVVVEAAFLDGTGDAREVLVDDAPGADVHVADFGIAHLSLGQAHRHAGGLQQAVRPVLPEPVPGRRVAEADGVVRPGRAVAPAVENHEYERFALHLGEAVLP